MTFRRRYASCGLARRPGSRWKPGGEAAVDYIWEFSGSNPQTFSEPGTGEALGTVADTRWHTGEWTIDVVPTEDAADYNTRHIAFSNGSNRLRLNTNVVELRVDGVAYIVNVATATSGDTLTIRVDHGTEIGVRINGGSESTTAITGGETWTGREANDWYVGNNSVDAAGFIGDIYQPVAV